MSVLCHSVIFPPMMMLLVSHVLLATSPATFNVRMMLKVKRGRLRKDLILGEAVLQLTDVTPHAVVRALLACRLRACSRVSVMYAVLWLQVPLKLKVTPTGESGSSLEPLLDVVAVYTYISSAKSVFIKNFPLFLKAARLKLHADALPTYGPSFPTDTTEVKADSDVEDDGSTCRLSCASLSCLTWVCRAFPQVALRPVLPPRKAHRLTKKPRRKKTVVRNWRGKLQNKLMLWSSSPVTTRFTCTSSWYRCYPACWMHVGCILVLAVRTSARFTLTDRRKT